MYDLLLDTANCPGDIISSDHSNSQYVIENYWLQKNLKLTG